MVNTFVIAPPDKNGYMTTAKHLDKRRLNKYERITPSYNTFFKRNN